MKSYAQTAVQATYDITTGSTGACVAVINIGFLYNNVNNVAIWNGAGYNESTASQSSTPATNGTIYPGMLTNTVIDEFRVTAVSIKMIPLTSYDKSSGQYSVVFKPDYTGFKASTNVFLKPTLFSQATMFYSSDIRTSSRFVPPLSTSFTEW